MTPKLLALILGLIGLLAGSMQFLDGEADGAQLSYYSNGNPKESAAFLDFERHGPCQRWYEDGTPRAEGEFEHGRKVGQWTWWTTEGEVDSERSGYYVDGRKTSG